MNRHFSVAEGLWKLLCLHADKVRGALLARYWTMRALQPKGASFLVLAVVLVALQLFICAELGIDEHSAQGLPWEVFYRVNCSCFPTFPVDVSAVRPSLHKCACQLHLRTSHPLILQAWCDCTVLFLFDYPSAVLSSV